MFIVFVVLLGNIRLSGVIFQRTEICRDLIALPMLISILLFPADADREPVRPGLSS